MARAEYRTGLQKEVSIMIVLSLLLQLWSSHGCLEEERAALLQLQHSFNYPNATSWLSWDMNIDCCKWYGVECDVTTGRVNELNLWGSRGESLGEWNFNASVFLPFQQLRSLDLEDNNIVCCIENEGFEGLQRLNLLKILYLNGNGLTNNVLSMFQRFHSLKILSLGFNKLSGSIYIKDLVKIPNLEELDLSGNNIEKFVSSEGFPIKTLKRLDLSYIPAGNSFLNSVANITSLESLQLWSCNLTVSIEELCKLKNLQKLDLQNNSVSGTLPHCLANLKLYYLDLSFNHFTGNILTSLLKSLTSIEYLFIAYNQFQIPISLSPFFNHSKLWTLHADGNKVYSESGGVDDNLTPKFQLGYLSLSSTYGEGGVSFPKFLHYQHDLGFLNLSGIQMRGAKFPSWLLDNNTNLGSLYLKNCSLSRMLHLSIHSHPKLDTLDISNNLFYGHIPTEIGIYFPMLYELYLTGNGFIGKIPNSLSNCSLLQFLDLSYNSLSDKISELIGNMSFLVLLDLSNNNLSRSLPSIFIPPRASYISLSHNRLEGTFPEVFINSSVLTLDLGHNYLSGGIPNSIKNVNGLTHLLLNHNDFEGEIPTYLWKMMKELKVVDLSHNRLGNFSIKNDSSGTFHGFVAPPISGETVEFGVKGNTYQFFSYRMIDINFIGLDLSSNKLTCPIPSEIGNKEGMKTLNLSHNNLIGHIPLSFSNMTELESLDLSYNNLNGTLPPQLVQLKSLEVFSVAYNNISGKTPKRVAQFGTFEENSYLGNPFLCGLPLPKNCTPTVLSSTKESPIDDTDDDGFIDREVFQISFWVTFTIILLGIVSVLYINPYWRQAWYYFIELTVTTCYYFLVDHLPFLSKFGNT